MNLAASLAEINSLPVPERIRFVDAIWEGIEAEWDAAESGSGELTDAQREELDRRAADADANPGASIPWEVVSGAALKRCQS